MGQQQFHAVQCFSCSTFQVQQVKKVAKFKCAVCGDKQSVRQVYAISDKAKDVRGVVSRLNTQRGEREQTAIDLLIAEPETACQFGACDQQALQQHQQPVQRVPWNDFLATQAVTEAPEEVVEPEDGRFITALPQALPRKRQRSARDAASTVDEPCDDETGGQISEASRWGRGSVTKDNAARCQQPVQRAAARRGGKVAGHTGAATFGRLPAEAEYGSIWSRSATGHSGATAAGQLPAEQCSGRRAGQPTNWRGDAAASGSDGPLLGSSVRTLGQTVSEAQPAPHSLRAMLHEQAVALACSHEHRQATGQLSDEEQEWPVHRFQRLVAQRKQKAQQAQHGAAVPQPPLRPTATRQSMQADGHFAAPLASHQNNILSSVSRAVSRDGSMLASDPAADCSRPLQQLPNGAGLASTAAHRTRAQQPAADNDAQTAAGHSRSNGAWPWEHAAAASATRIEDGGGSRQRGTGSALTQEHCSSRQGSSERPWHLQGVGAGGGSRKQEQQGGTAGRPIPEDGRQQGAAGGAWGAWLDGGNASRPVTAGGQQQAAAGGAWGAWLDDGRPAVESAGARDMPVATEPASNAWAAAAGDAPQHPQESQLVLGL